MQKKNQSNYYFVLIKRNKKSKSKYSAFDFVVAKKRGHNYYNVIEKLGSVDYCNRLIHFNFFRLTFWLTYSPAPTAEALKFLFKYIFKKY